MKKQIKINESFYEKLSNMCYWINYSLYFYLRQDLHENRNIIDTKSQIKNKIYEYEKK